MIVTGMLRVGSDLHVHEPSMNLVTKRDLPSMKLVTMEGLTFYEPGDDGGTYPL